MRSIKIGLEYRIKTEISTESAIMQWIVEHATVVMNRCAVGKDGKTAYRRLFGKDSKKPLIEFGEQVLVKPMRAPASRRKRSFKYQRREGTWVGVNFKTGEHLVVLAGGGAVIRVATAERRASDERWSLHDKGYEGHAAGPES